MRQKVWSGFILTLFIIHNVFGTGGSDWAGALTGIATSLKGVQQAQQDKNKSDEKQQQLDQQLGKVTSQENFATGQGQTKGLYTNPVQNLGTPNQGYPIVDPYKNPGYWAQRGQQFQFNMTMAAKRAGLTNEKAAEALAAERQMTNKMLGAVGGLMQTAGGQMEKIGAERAKAAETEEKKQNEDFIEACSAKPDECQRTEIKDDEGKGTGKFKWTMGDQTKSEEQLGGVDAVESARSQGLARASDEEFLNDPELSIENRGGAYYDEDGNYLGNNPTEVAAKVREQAATAAEEAEKKRQDLLSDAKITLNSVASSMNATGAAGLVEIQLTRTKTDAELQDLIDNPSKFRTLVTTAGSHLVGPP
jgi:hypothetical protein